MKPILLSLITILLISISNVQAQIFVKVTESIVSIDSGASRSVNWIDYDNDNDLDLFISNGYRYGQDNLLYRNDNSTFVKITDQPVVSDSLPSDGASWGDFNNDGLPDLCVVNWWGKISLLYENNGNGNFTFMNSSPVCSIPSYSETCSWGDYNNDGLLDLFITNSEGVGGHRNFLYKNLGNNNFVKIDTGIAVTESGNARGVNWVDIDNDRDLDIFVCRESNNNEYLYKNNGNGYFTKVTGIPLTSSGGDSWSGSWGDYDNDGDLDVFITNASNQKNFLFRNDGDFNFTKINDGPLVNENGYNAVGSWGDFDNDGDLDMFVSQAYVPPSFTVKLVNKLYRNMLMETGSPTFQKVTSGQLVNDSGYTYGFAWGDYDKDGDLDIACANTFGENQKNALYRNDLTNGHKWLSVKCVGTGTLTNKSGIGTKVRVKSTINGVPTWQMQVVDGQSGYCAQNLLLHFGLGNASVVDSIKVEWPAGSDQYFTNVPVNQGVTITENGTLISVDEKKTEEVSDFELYQNYPNPFNPETRISYILSKGQFVKLSVYDAIGNEIETLINESQRPGHYDVSFNANGYSSGIYFYKLISGNFIETKKMILVK